jgi:hypothetical protein
MGWLRVIVMLPVFCPPTSAESSTEFGNVPVTVLVQLPESVQVPAPDTGTHVKVAAKAGDAPAASTAATIAARAIRGRKGPFIAISP